MKIVTLTFAATMALASAAHAGSGLSAACDDVFVVKLDGALIPVIGNDRYVQLAKARIGLTDDAADAAVSKIIEGWIAGGEVDGIDMMQAIKTVNIDMQTSTECESEADLLVLQKNVRNTTTYIKQFGEILKAMSPKNRQAAQ